MIRVGALSLLGGLAVIGSAAPHLCAAPYTAYSLRVARQRIERAGEKWRLREPEVLNLAGINKVEGFVWDGAVGDLILVGLKEAGRAALGIDDLVVALRARFIRGQWPGVSIDPTADTEKTQLMRVRFEGGVQDTGFGQALYDADYRLKELSMGLQPTGVAGLRTAWDRDVEELSNRAEPGQRNIGSRFWFYPISPHVMVREGICVVRGLRIGVFTEVVAAKINGKSVPDLKSFKNASDEAWASDVSQRYDQLGEVQPSFNRLRGLQELVAVSKALEELEERPDLGWWLEKYPLERRETPREVKVLRRRHNVRGGWLEVSGGVHLTALAMRLNAGDVKALREVVLQVRPSAEALSWGFVAAEWVIPIGAAQTEPVMALAGRLETGDISALRSAVLQDRSSEDALSWVVGVGKRPTTIAEGQVKAEGLVPLMLQARFLFERERYTDALAVLDEIVKLEPRYAAAWYDRGLSLGHLGRHQDALNCFVRSLEISPGEAAAWRNKCVAIGKLGRTEEEVQCYDHALEINPHQAEIWTDKGEILVNVGRYAEALASAERALQIDARLDRAWHVKGFALFKTDRWEAALAAFDHALEINPRYAEAWTDRGVALERLGRTREETQSYERALEVDPRYAEAWYNKGDSLQRLQRYEEALRCYDRALEIDSRYYKAWYNRGTVLADLGRYLEELQSYDRALEIEPLLVEAWHNKGIVLSQQLGRYREALECFDRVLEIDPRHADAWCNKGVALGILGRSREALPCFDRALEIDARHAKAWYNKGLAFYALREYSEARRAFEKAAQAGHPRARQALETLRRE